MKPYDLDNLIGTLTHRLRQWSPSLGSSKAWDILYHLIRCMWCESNGQIRYSRLTYAQASISINLGINKKWVNVLSQRLVKTGWLEYETIKLPDGTNSSCVWRAGRLLKRLMATVANSKQRKSSIKHTVANARTTVLSSKESEEEDPSCRPTGGSSSDGISYQGKGGQGRKWWEKAGRETGREARARLEAEQDAEVERYLRERGGNVGVSAVDTVFNLLRNLGLS